MSALLAALVNEALNDATPAEPPAPGDKLGQRVKLLERFAALQDRHRFKPKQLVAEKEGLAPLNLGGEALIV